MKYARMSALLLLLANPHPQTATVLTTMQTECHAVTENVCPRYILASPPPPEKQEGRICPTKTGHPESLSPGHNRQTLFLSKNREGPPQAAAHQQIAHFW